MYLHKAHSRNGGWLLCMTENQMIDHHFSLFSFTSFTAQLETAFKPGQELGHFNFSPSANVNISCTY